MKKSSIKKMPEFFDRYINLVEDIDVIVALEKYSDLVSLIGKENIINLDGKQYAPGKWTIKDIIQHVTDTERILSYRALRLARHDATPLPGFDEDNFAKYAAAERRSFEDLWEENRQVRKASIMLFKSITEDMLQQNGICSDKEISVLALGFVIAGHPLHHVKIVQERYLPLLT